MLKFDKFLTGRCDCEGAFTNGRGFFCGSILTKDDDLGKLCFIALLEVVEIPEVDGSEEIEGIETFEIFFVSSGFLDEL